MSGALLVLRAIVAAWALAAPPPGAAVSDAPTLRLAAAADGGRVAAAISGPTADSVGRLERPTAPARVDGKPSPFSTKLPRTAPTVPGPLDAHVGPRSRAEGRVPLSLALHASRVGRPRMLVDGPPDH